MTETVTIRAATPADAERCSQIYRRYVQQTPITFETDPPDSTEMARRMAKAAQRHAWLVLESEGQVMGYAYGGEYKTRPAYRWASEVSVYLEMGRRRTGAGRALYQALIRLLAARGYRRQVAGITLPNEASVGLHRAMGFTEVGVYRKVGWKNGAWHDVAWMQLDLTPDENPTHRPTEVI